MRFGRPSRLLQVKTVGVMGDYRAYDYVVGLRAVTSSDGMTADFYPFDMAFIGKVATRIINEVKGVNRVVYDVTSKPARHDGVGVGTETPEAPPSVGNIHRIARRSDLPVSGRWKFRVDPRQTARSVEHVMAVSD
jgi:hypothetical protein